MLRNYPDGDVKVIFLLHTNADGKPATTEKDLKAWDLRVRWPAHGMSLADGDGIGANELFPGVESGNVVLQRGFKVHAIDVEDYGAAVKAALDAR